MLAVLNNATRVTNADAALAVRACAHQLRYDAAPAWAKAPTGVIFYVDPAHVPPGAWRIVIFDDADQAGDLGWHSEGPDGLPFGRVFATPVLDNGGAVLEGKLTVSSVLSHEVLEAFVDPSVNLSADDFAGGTWALEVGDPVESDSYTVPITDRAGTAHLVAVSDFATPAWFDPQAGAHARFDWLGKVTRPFTLAPGGYAIKNGAAVWGEKYPAWRRLQREAEFLEARQVRATAETTGFVSRGPIGRAARRIRPTALNP